MPRCRLSTVRRPRNRDRAVADDGGLRRRVPAEERREAEARIRSRLRRWLFNGDAPQPLPSHLGTVEDPEAGKLGVCCSGGGVRSAAFCLGALQALQEKSELRRAAYLAAVSGGSYIAGALSMVALTGGSGNSSPALFASKKPFAPRSPEEQYVRNRASYLAPTLGEKIYLGWRVVLGLLFNLAFLIAPVVGTTFVLTGLFYAPMLSGLAGPCEEGRGGPACGAHVPPEFWIAPVAALLVAIVFGLATLVFRWHKERWERFFAAWSVRALVLAGVLALLLLALPYLVEWLEGSRGRGETVNPSREKTGVGFSAGLIALLAGVAAQLTHLLSSKTAVQDAGRAQKAFSKLGSAARVALGYLAAALAGPLLLFAVVAVTLATGLGHAANDGHVDLSSIEVGLVILAAFAVVYRFADLTTWSLHPFYKRRLSSAFALKRVAATDLSEEEKQRFELIEGDGATAAGVAVERDFDELVTLSDTALAGAEAGEWPTLLVCAAANISDSAATPPGRGVTSFTFSARTVGGPLVGAVATWELENAFQSREEAFPTPKEEQDDDEVLPAPHEDPAEDEDPAEGGAGKPITAWTARRARERRRRDLSLPAVIAMSGAAISPSMGKMTRRPLTFLMAMANIRLGVWVPNPRWLAEFERSKRLRKRYLRPRPFYLLCELLGLNRVGAKYLYVTDGGHYENLGLVELLRRGCTEVYCFDASGVGKGRAEFEALGDAIALARSELGVEIAFESDPDDLAPDKESHVAKADMARGRIQYPDGSSGTLIYVRNSITPKAPWDAQAYHRADPRFPHNPTVDQLYTDQKFEAYRVLGQRAGEEAVRAMSGGCTLAWWPRC